jgi:CheY-like chemotaxis protein
MTLPLSNRRILIVEDESLVAMLLETILEDMGCAPVGPISNVEDALALLASPEIETLDGALLDVNVAGTEVFPVAEVLKARGLPFVFSTGYGQGGLPDQWRDHAVIQKPFTETAVQQALMTALGVAQV